MLVSAFATAASLATTVTPGFKSCHTSTFANNAIQQMGLSVLTGSDDTPRLIARSHGFHEVLLNLFRQQYELKIDLE